MERTMSKSIYLRRAFTTPFGDNEYFVNWENDTIIPLYPNSKTNVAMYTNGATRVSITLDINVATNVNVYVDSISYNLYSDFLDPTGKLVCTSLFPALSIVAGIGRVFVSAPCAFECMKIGVETIGGPGDGSIFIVGWNEMGNP